jgi:hypothetical protein
LLAIASLFLGVLPGCRGSTPAKPPLRPHELALVDLYVQITQIEARRSTVPDSVGPALDRLAAAEDSIAVRDALEALKQEPERWEYVWDEIHRRLREQEESPTPP